MLVCLKAKLLHFGVNKVFLHRFEYIIQLKHIVLIESNRTHDYMHAVYMVGQCSPFAG